MKAVYLIFLLLAVAMPFQQARSRGAVCLFDSTDIYIKGNLTAVVKVHKSLEINSEAGLRFAQVVIPVNDYIQVKDIKGYTELPGGGRIKLTRQDIGTSSAPGFRGFGGVQVVTFSFGIPAMGSKIYYEYKLIVKSLLYLPRITRRTDYPTNRLQVSLRWDKKARPRYDAEGFEIKSHERFILFSARDLPELPDEPLSCPDQLHVSISSDAFSYSRMKYRSGNWADVGRFFAQLSLQPEGTEKELRQLTERLTLGALTLQDTLSAFYNFLADSVSYVALQVGKGDFTPHSCPVIINRRYGDCKDQSVLLSSLCRVVGIDAYPALISTAEYPDVDSLHPWPAWFDHVITVIKRADGNIILDPSDPLNSLSYLPPRLRGKSYLICDGISGLKKAPDHLAPAEGIFWRLNLTRITDNKVDAEFNFKYLNDAAATLEAVWEGTNTDQVTAILDARLKSAGWNLFSIHLGNIDTLADTLNIDGDFAVSITDAGNSRNMAISSPLIDYLLTNYFADLRITDLCRIASIHLEELMVVDLGIPGVVKPSAYTDSLKENGVSFKDELRIDHNRAVYHRSFTTSAGALRASAYNTFRDFLLSRRNQQYVRFQK